MHALHIAGSAKPLSIAALLSLALAGCASLPYSPTTETAAAGAVAGAVAGSVIGEEDEGAIWGALAGAGLGYVLASETDWFSGGGQADGEHHHHSSSSHGSVSFYNHVANARVHRATVASVYADDDADLNGDGLVTMDELIAMAHSELSEDQVIARLQATDQVFFLSPGQRQRLLGAGVSADVVAEVDALKQASAGAGAGASH